MVTASTTGWRNALDEIEQAIGDCLAALDRYEAAFTRVLAATPEETPAAPATPDIGGKAATWDERLATAGNAADAVEKLLAEQEQVWGRWRTALADWQRLAADGTTAGAAATNETGGG